jgi:hypothetical protein
MLVILIGAIGGALGFKDYKTVAEKLRERCKELVNKGQAARTRIIALEGELAAAMNEKESAVQWAQVCHRRATGAEEAAIYAKDDVRRIKQLMRKTQAHGLIRTLCRCSDQPTQHQRTRATRTSSRRACVLRS